MKSEVDALKGQVQQLNQTLSIHNQQLTDFTQQMQVAKDETAKNLTAGIEQLHSETKRELEAEISGVNNKFTDRLNEQNNRMEALKAQDEDTLKQVFELDEKYSIKHG